MKKTISLLTMLLLCVCFIFTGCATNLTMPTGAISSNGGSVVKIGDYIYFANTFVDYKTLVGNDNQNSTVKHNAIYRLKTENNKVLKDDDDNVENLEKVYNKIAGYETSSMFIVGEYLYFTSPNAHKNTQTSEDKFDTSTLFRIKLDGTDFKEILSTEAAGNKFYVAGSGENQSLLIYDNSKILSLKLQNNLAGAETLAKDVSGVVFPKFYNQDITTLYYTKDLTKQDGKDDGVTGNKLFSLNLATKENKQIRFVAGETITLTAFEGGRIYYTRTVNSVDLYFSNTPVSGFETNEQQHTVVSGVTNFTALGSDSQGNSIGSVFTYNSKFYLQLNNQSATVLPVNPTKVHFVNGDYIYYSTAEGIFRISYKDKQEQTIAKQQNINEQGIDFDGKYIYFYAQTETNSSQTYYLYRADANIADRGMTEVICLASVLAEDK